MNNTLITPAYRASRFMEEYLDHVCHQNMKPDELLIGVDCCMNTLKSIADIGSKFKQAKFKIKVLYFTKHVGCYIIRNTLAKMSSGKYLHFFDVDDIMYRDHIEEMHKALSSHSAPSCVYPLSRKKEPCMCDQVLNVEGAFSIDRGLFMKYNGFEPWPVGADSDFKYRLQNFGENIVYMKKETMSHVKHPGSLTRNQETGIGTPFRKEYQKRCEERKRRRIVPDMLHTEECEVFNTER